MYVMNTSSSQHCNNKLTSCQLMQYRDSLRLARRRKHALKSNLSYDEHDDILVPRVKSISSVHSSVHSSLHSRRHSSFSTYVVILTLYLLLCTHPTNLIHRMSSVDTLDFETSSVKSFSSTATTTVDQTKSRRSWLVRPKTSSTSLKTKSVDDILFNVHRVDNLLMA